MSSVIALLLRRENAHWNYHQSNNSPLYCFWYR